MDEPRMRTLRNSRRNVNESLVEKSNRLGDEKKTTTKTDRNVEGME
jgi:hypothetical protein